MSQACRINHTANNYQQLHRQKDMKKVIYMEWKNWGIKGGVAVVLMAAMVGWGRS